MKVTLKDIAAQSGVSISTVSRILANDTRRKISAKTRQNVLQAAGRLGYLGEAERERAPRASRCLGVLYTPTANAGSDPFFAGITTGVQMQAAALNYTIGFTFSHIGDSLDGIRASLASTSLDGVILLGRFSRDFFGTVLEYNPNTVYAGLNTVEFRCNEVIGDAREAIRIGVTHLHSLGYRKIGYIGPHVNQYGTTVINEHRYDAFRRTLMELGLPCDEKAVRLTGTTIEDGYNAMLDILDRGVMPRAVQCGCDEIALGVINAAQKRSVRIPRDLAVVGLEDISVASYLKPALTTIHVPDVEIGKLAVTMLDQRCRDGDAPVVRMELPCRLVVRDSCGGRA